MFTSCTATIFYTMTAHGEIFLPPEVVEPKPFIFPIIWETGLGKAVEFHGNKTR